MNGVEITEKIAFFFNTYQCMYIHNFLLLAEKGEVDDNSCPQIGFFTKIKKSLEDEKLGFCYNIDGVNYTMDEIKHGMLHYN